MKDLLRFIWGLILILLGVVLLVVALKHPDVGTELWHQILWLIIGVASIVMGHNWIKKALK